MPDSDDDEDVAEGLPIPSSDHDFSMFDGEDDPITTPPASPTPKTKSQPPKAPRKRAQTIKSEEKTTIMVPKPETTSARPQKRKSLMESAKDTLSDVRSSRLKMTETKVKGKVAQKKAKEERKLRIHEADVQLEREKLAHAERESALQRAHELAMMQAQLELQRLRQPGPGQAAGVGYGGAVPQLPGGPQGPWMLDPALR